jgi:Family of unknown function (DUF6527)
MRVSTFEHRFVEYVPAALEEGVVYVSTTYATVVHRCACGCGTKVVTPLSPAEWTVSFDGESISLSPSIGNWQFPCRSHYWIRRNTVRWAASWTSQEIAAADRRDADDLDRYFAQHAQQHTDQEVADVPGELAGQGWIRRFWRRVSGR